MRRRATILIAAAFCTFAAGTSVVTASAAPTGRAAVGTATGTKGSGWNAKSLTAASHRIDVATRSRGSVGAKPNVGQLPLLVRDPAAYAAAKKNPKATPGLAITQPASAPSSGALSPQVSTFSVNFAGINSATDSGNNGGTLFQPPDTQIGVGPTWILEMVNSQSQVYDRAGNLYPSAIGTNSLDSFFGISQFWSHTFFGGEQMVATDPRVLYDPATGRYYASVLAYDQTNFDSITLLGISDGGDPALGWTIYGMDVESSVFFPPTTSAICDQPKLGFSSDKFVIGCSLFSLVNSSPVFQGALLMVGTKAQGLAGVNMDEREFGPNTSAFGLVPAQNLTGGVAAAYVAFNLSDNGSGTAATHVTTVTGTPTANNLLLSDKNVAMGFTAFPPPAPQHLSTTLIDTGDDRFMSAFVQGGTLYTSGGESCTPAGDTAVRSCLRLVEVNLSLMTLIQGATAGLVGNYLINPTLGVNSNGDVVFVYSTSSASTFPDLETAIQPAGDPNTIVGGGQVVAGTGPYMGTTSVNQPNARWGDYAAVGVDPGNTAYIWVAGEFSNGVGPETVPMWATQIAVLNGHIAQVCTAQTFTTDLGSPQKPSVTITLTATAACVSPATPVYQFWIKAPGTTTLVMAQDYSANNTYSWTNHVTLGTYTLEVLVKASTETAKNFDSYLPMTYTISAAACSKPTLAASPSSYPQVAGTSVLLTASSTCSDTTPLYQFWVQTPDLAFHMLQDYSPTNTASWTNNDTQIGNYTLEVLVRNTGSLAAYDTFTSIPYAMQLCNTPTLSTGTATSPYISGSGAITLTASATCVGGAQYAFYYYDTSFHLIQAYSASNTATWKADYKAGSYNLLVEVRPAGSSAAFVTYLFINNFVLTGCGTVTLAPDKASPQVAGTTVTWTATVTCSGTAQYKFWVYSPVSGWSVGQDWSTTQTFPWASPTTAGNYLVEVWVRNQGANDDLYDNYFVVTYLLS